MIKYFCNIFITFTFFHLSRGCKISETTASGTGVINGQTFCPGEKIFEDDFNSLDSSKWKHASTLSGSGNWEFEWYTNDRQNSFTYNGKLYIRPTLTSAKFGEHFLTSGYVDLNRQSPRCTDYRSFGCFRRGNLEQIINPIRSARLDTKESFSFKYGRVEVSAKLPAGDWLWPAIWLNPTREVYGNWPMSGEIDIVEGRGNRNLRKNSKNIGTEQMSSTLHFGPNSESNGLDYTHFVKNLSPGFNTNFHKYEFIWTPQYIQFRVDNEVIGTVQAGEGFFKKGNFRNSLVNPWQTASRMAPFDQEFHLVMNVAVGGINGYFPDNAQNPGGKPWSNNSPNAATDFWNGRSAWLPTWPTSNNNMASALVVDYIRVFAI